MRNPLQNLAYRLTMSSDNRHKPPYIPTTTDILGLWRVPEKDIAIMFKPLCDSGTSRSCDVTGIKYACINMTPYVKSLSIHNHDNFPFQYHIIHPKQYRTQVVSFQCLNMAELLNSCSFTRVSFMNVVTFHTLHENKKKFASTNIEVL